MNKKHVQIIVITVVAVWIFCASLMIGLSKAKKQNNEITTTASQSAQITSQLQTVPPTSEAAPDVTIDGNLVVTSVSSSASDESTSESVFNNITESTIPSDKQEIVKAYLTAVNKLKTTPNFRLVKTEDLHIIVDEMNPSSVKSIVSKIIDNNTDSEPVSYTFINGIDTVTGMSPGYVIAPLGKTAALSTDIVTNASSTKNADGSYTLYISLGQEVQTLSVPAPNYSTSMEVIEIEDLGLPSSARVDEASITYDNSRIEATVDSDGRITSMKHYLEVPHSEGNGSLVVPVVLAMHGYCTNTYQITY